MTLPIRLLICSFVFALVGISSAAPTPQVSPKKSDISTLHNTFWHLIQLKGAHADFSRVVIRIQLIPGTTGGNVTFSSLSFYSSFPFYSQPSGLQFFPASTRRRDTKNGSPDDAETGRFFEEVVLHLIKSFERKNDNLIFSDKAGSPVLVLRHFRKRGIENRVWTIAKYKNSTDAQADHDGLVETKYPADITFWHGRVDGSPGCGGWHGSYELADRSIVVDAGFFLAGLCYPQAMTQAYSVVHDFRGELRIKQKGAYVLLRDKDGKAKVLLTPQ